MNIKLESFRNNTPLNVMIDLILLIAVLLLFIIYPTFSGGLIAPFVIIMFIFYIDFFNLHYKIKLHKI